MRSGDRPDSVFLVFPAPMGRTSNPSELKQGVLFDLACTSDVDETREPPPRTFVEPSSSDLSFGGRRLGAYLEECGEVSALRLAEALRTLDWNRFEKSYARAGRAPYAPRLMVGLLMYGLLKGVNSLRGLESLSRRDLGCMWVCSGIQPDHSNIGRFVLRHASLFEGEFFAQVTRLALRVTASGVEDVAGDGTAIQAAASRYRTLKREALDRKLESAKQEFDADPDAPESGQRLAKYSAADEALTEREAKRQAKCKPTDTLRVSTTEPEAAIQPLKNKSFAPSYKPSVLANASRVVVGKAVDPTDESCVVGGMLDEAESIGGTQVKSLKVDGNYHNKTILNMSLDRDIDLLCPEHGARGKQSEKLKKSDFVYDAERDVYICPNKRVLERRSEAKDGSYVQYERSACEGCPLLKQCYSAKSTRRVIRRQAIDEAKEALREVMAHPGAQKAYAQRKAMVEPVFSFTREVMNLRRFRRRGLSKVRTEFSLYTAAYNLGRVLARVLGLWMRLFFPIWARALRQLDRRAFSVALAQTEFRRAF